MELGGVKARSALVVASLEMRGTAGTDHGYTTTTMENGDTAVASWHGRTRWAKESFTESGTWTFVRGTGKLKGITGGASYRVAGDTIRVQGEYRLSPGKVTANEP